MYPSIQVRQRSARLKLWLIVFLILLGLTTSFPATVTAAVQSVNILAPDGGEILDGTATLRANVVSDTPVDAVEFFYRPHDDMTAISLGLATFDSGSGFWVYDWDTTTVTDTHTDINGTDVFLTKPPTHDELSVVATSGASVASDAIDVRVQNMLTVRFTLPDNQEDQRGFVDIETILTGEFAITSVRFDIYDLSAVDQRIFIPFGEATEMGEPIENPHYGRPLGDPDFPTGSALYPIGEANPEGSKRWVFRNWDTTTIPDGTYALVATAEDADGRRATYTVETYIVNDLNVVITAPDDGATVSRFVALEARTSSMTGADDAARGSLWPATSVEFDISGTTIVATENPSGSGRWRAIWEGDSFAPGPYTITATAANENPNGPEIAVDSVAVTLVEPGPDLEAFFPFDWSYCTLYVCSFLDGSSGGPTAWLWDFGDGNTSTAQLPTHTYSTYGIYTVTLTVSDGVDSATYSRVIPVGNTGAVGFNINPINDDATEFINWTSAFKNFNYAVGDTLAIPVMWKSTTGATEFDSLPTTVCDADENTPGPCALFTPEEADGTPPILVGAAEDGVLFTMTFTEVQYRGITDIFKGKVNVGVVVNVDSGDGNPDLDWQARLGTNVDVTNIEATGGGDPVVAITSPVEGSQVGGTVDITAATVSSVTADQVEFFVNGASIGVDTDDSDGWSASWDTTSGYPDGPYELTSVASGSGFTVTSPVRTVTVANTPPTAVISSATCINLTCAFDGSGSFDLNGTIASYDWTFLNGAAPVGAKSGATTTFTFPNGGTYTAQLVVTDNDGGTGAAATPVTVTVIPGTFQIGTASDAANPFLNYPHELEEDEEECPPQNPDCGGGGGPPPVTPIDASMTAEFSNIVVIPGGGVIGGDALEFDVTITNTSGDPNVVLSAYAFQSKVSESPALASRVGDKLFYGQTVPGSLVLHQPDPEDNSAMGTVKKNGTSNGLFTGKWKGICINSSQDFIPEFNSGLEDEALECAGNRADTNFDGEPELQTGVDMLGLRPGESQTIRLR